MMYSMTNTFAACPGILNTEGVLWIAHQSNKPLFLLVNLPKSRTKSESPETRHASKHPVAYCVWIKNALCIPLKSCGIL